MEPTMTQPVMTGPSGGPAGGPAPACRGFGAGGARSRLWTGLLLIGLGLLFALAAFGGVDLHPLRQLGPLLLIFFGVGITLRSRGRRAGGLVLLFLGAWFLLRNFGLLPFDERLFPASILVVAGLAVALSSLAPRRRLTPPGDSPWNP